MVLKSRCILHMYLTVYYREIGEEKDQGGIQPYILNSQVMEDWNNFKQARNEIQKHGTLHVSLWLSALLATNTWYVSILSAGDLSGAPPPQFVILFFLLIYGGRFLHMHTTTAFINKLSGKTILPLANDAISISHYLFCISFFLLLWLA